MESASLEGSVKILVLIGAVDDDSKMKYILASIKAGIYTLDDFCLFVLPVSISPLAYLERF